MPITEDALFGRGKTYGTTTITEGVEFEGIEKLFTDTDWSNPPKRRSNANVLCRIVRNVAAIDLLAKRLVSVNEAVGIRSRVVGYADTTAERCYPLDEFLPTAGLLINDLGWIVVKGPAIVLTDLAGGANNVITVGGKVVSLTAATSGATTAGRAAPITDFAGANSTGSALANAVMHYIGHALSSVTTSNTNADLLVDIGSWF